VTQPVKRIDALALTTFKIEPDGSRVHFQVRDGNGSQAELVLPATCLNQLLMTLPAVIQEVLRKAHRDDSMRVAYPLERYRIELAEPRAKGPQPFILTLETGDGFAVSFAAAAELWVDIARSIFGDVESHPAAQLSSPRLS
jgi:hypothetical protein